MVAAVKERMEVVQLRYSSPARCRRNALRHWLHCRRRAPHFTAEMQWKHTERDLLQIGLSLERALLRLRSRGGFFADYYWDWLRNAPTARREFSRKRGVWPLPPSQMVAYKDYDNMTCLAKLLCNLCIAALNVLHHNMKPPSSSTLASPSLAQTGVITHVAKMAQKLEGRLASVDGLVCPCARPFESIEPVHQPPPVELVAERVDLPGLAATCDPCQLLPDELAEPLKSVATFFDGMATRPGFEFQGSIAKRTNYAKLVHRELKCGKVRLRLDAKGCADVFAVAKPGKHEIREVWNGHEISVACARPPAPPRLANPSLFLELFNDPKRPFLVSKRDMQTYFDSLRAPDALKEFLARPGIRAGILSKVMNMSLHDLRTYIDGHVADITGDTVLFPCSEVWPMGFAWSAFVAQACTLEIMRDFGMPLENVLDLESPAPAATEQEELVGISTDDAIFFHRDRAQGFERLNRYDDAVRRAGAIVNERKNVTLQTSMTALGCDIDTGMGLVCPEAGKHARFLWGMIDFLLRQTASPKGFSALLGVGQWFALLLRATFSCFQHVYAFARSLSHDVVKVPDKVILECNVFLFLQPLIAIDMNMPLSCELLACDASPEFGFGVVKRTVSPELVSELNALTEKRGDYVRLQDADGDEKVRLGNPHRIPLNMDDFTCLISVRAKWKAH